MADLTIQNLSDEDGGAVTFASAATGGDKFVWDSRAAIIIQNGDASAHDVTVNRNERRHGLGDLPHRE